MREIGDLQRFDLVFACQTMFFLDAPSISKLLRAFKPGVKVIFGEPVNADYARQEASSALDLKNSVGFSHNYPHMLRQSGYSFATEHLLPYGKLLISATKSA